MTLSRILILALLALTAGLWLSCEEEKDPDPRPPASPTLLAIIGVAQTEIDMNWHDASIDETGFRVERKQSGGDWVTDGTVGANIASYTSTELTASTPYTFRVWAYNDAGDSESPSNEQTATTQSADLAPRPLGVSASAIGSNLVLITWSDPGELDSFRIQRGLDVSTWSTIATVPDGEHEYEDGSVTPATTYYYRVGSVNEAGVNWGIDTAEVTTPEIGTPTSPSNLTADFDLLTGITLNWQDHSNNEHGFHVSRNVSGQAYQIIDTLEADVTTYMDASVVNENNTYGYRVRAFNEHGLSGWSNIVNVDFNFYSEGTIPLHLGTRWLYNVDDSENDEQYQIQRIVRGVEFVGGVDHYGVIETTYPGEGSVDTLYYLRNFSGIGCKGALPPLTGASTSDLLFQDPPSIPGSVNARYNFNGDSVIVLSRSTTISIEDSTFTGVMSYQRWFRGDPNQRSIKYWIVPNTIGIIKEEEYFSSTRSVTREIFFPPN